MAIWQFDLYFLPIDEPGPDTSKEEWDAPALPLGEVRQAQEHLAHYFGPPWFMLEDWLVFGPENGNRIDIQFDQELAASIFVRCDLRSEAPQFLSIVADLARLFDCGLFCLDNEEVIEANALKLMQAATDRRDKRGPDHMGYIE